MALSCQQQAERIEETVLVVLVKVTLWVVTIVVRWVYRTVCTMTRGLWAPG